MEYENNDRYENERKINKTQIEIIKRIVCDNINLPAYYIAYVDKRVNLHVNSKCTCPMHEESEPSFRYFEETNTFSCFGKCHVAGDIIKFHESYLKYLFRTGQLTKYRAITKLKPDKINYYTAMEDLIKLYNLKAPVVFIDDSIKKKITKEDMYAFFENIPKKLELTKEELTFNEIDKIVMQSLINLKRRDINAYKLAYKKYIKILTSGPVQEEFIESLKELRKEIT